MNPNNRIFRAASRLHEQGYWSIPCSGKQAVLQYPGQES